MLIEEDEKNEKKRLEKDKQENSCIICGEHLQEGLPIVLKTCKCVFHLDCLKPYFKEEIDKGTIEIKCPLYSTKPDCNKTLSHKDLMRVLSQEMFDKWAQMSLTRAVDTMEDMSWCPTPGCGYAFVKDFN